MFHSSRVHPDGDKNTYKAAFFLAGNLSAFHQVAYPLGLLLHSEQVCVPLLLLLLLLR